MYSKKYMYDAGQKACMELIQDGYVRAFEEIFNLMNLNKAVREKAELGLEKTMPKDFSKEPEHLRYITKNLKDAEEATRKGAVEGNYESRMDLGKYFQELEGYQWLAAYFYDSSHPGGSSASVDVQSAITSMQQQALIEESRGNADIALKVLKKALRIVHKNSLEETDPTVKTLYENLSRIYHQLGTKYLDQESDYISAKESISLKFFKKAAELSMKGDDLEIQAACQALLGKALMKFNNDESALKSFELYAELCEKCDDKYGMCQGYFAISEVLKKTENLEKSVAVLNICQEIAKEHSFDIPFTFSAISLGQIETVKRQYSKANTCFKLAYDTMIKSSKDYKKKKSLKKLTRVMCGIGKAHMTFDRLIHTLDSTTTLSMPKLLSWRRVGGPFTGEIKERQDCLIDLDEVESEHDEAKISVIIDKLIKHELNQE